MAKEMMIIFVYDTQLVQREEDDPATAILYFHPGWVSDQQRTSLCGQIIGSCHFLNSCFNAPKIFALQSGKFAVRLYGRYILAVGTDRNVADWVLEHRAETLTSIISFFHNDLEKLSELYEDKGKLSGKLYLMFETYLKILMYGGHMFFNMPTIELPKSASHVFLEAIQLLESCQQLDRVLGGTILYHNKVVATQLPSALTKRLVLTDPYRIKSPAEAFVTGFDLPLGVQLLIVYIPHKDYRDLREDSSKCRCIPQYLNKLSTKKTSSKSVPTREPMLSVMKRDQSLIFTTVPEEDSDRHSPVNPQDKINDAKSPDRPKFLNLKHKTTDTKFEVVRTETKPVPTTPFLGQTSVCSTPMTDLNKVIHQNIMSICVNPEEVDKSVQENLNNSSKTFANGTEQIQPVAIPPDESDFAEDSGGDKLKSCIPYMLGDAKLYDKKKNASMWEFREKLKSFNKRITMQYYNMGLPNLTDDVEMLEQKVPKKICYNTISDPLYPIFKSSGLSVSNHLYNQYLQDPIDFLNLELEPNKIKNDSNTNTDEWKSVEDFDHLWSSPKKPKKISLSSPPPLLAENAKKLEKPETPTASKEPRKSLTLPLKSLTSSEQPDNMFSPSSRSRNYGGMQLTPLLCKLSQLAMEEKSSGFCSRDTTPGEYKDARFTPSQSSYNFLRRKSSVSEEPDSNSDGLHEVVLFICGQQDMVMGVLLEQQACHSPDVINQLFEKCTNSLGKLEKQLRHCLETYPGGSGSSESGEPYSYLCMDPQWDTVQRGGPWGGVELGVLTHLHRDFINMSNLTEIILRNDDSIIYGHHCGKTEVFYQQVASSAAGLPTPADSMGTVSLKAKRRLERDHAIILL